MWMVVFLVTVGVAVGVTKSHVVQGGLTECLGNFSWP